MSAEDPDPEGFEETIREIAREMGESVERAIDQFDLDELAGSIGVDADRAREWVDSAGSWLRSRVERLGDDVAAQAAGASKGPGSSKGPGASKEAGSSPAAGRAPESPAGDPWRGLGPHPLDIPTEEQGLALAALDSGRWEVEPGSNRLSSHGEGPAPSSALGLVGELRARDWITADGEVTLVGHHAIGRWLESSSSR